MDLAVAGRRPERAHVARATGALLIEDLHAGIGDQRALFHLLNRVREHKLSMLPTSRLAPGELAVTLPELRSRLRALPLVTISPPTRPCPRLCWSNTSPAGSLARSRMWSAALSGVLRRVAVSGPSRRPAGAAEPAPKKIRELTQLGSDLLRDAEIARGSLPQPEVGPSIIGYMAQPPRHLPQVLWGGNLLRASTHPHSDHKVVR
jgi:hypothetical protein